MERRDFLKKTGLVTVGIVDNYIPNVINEDAANAAPDEEDLTLINGLLKLKDRDSHDGKGYVILRLDKSFAEQVTINNTIYEIRYDFDLDGKSVTIPAGCVLEFEGGSLSNGTISADASLTIRDDGRKIFDDIKFVGACIFNNVYVSWFISSYPKNTNDYTINNTDEIYQALESGGRRIIFPADKFLHITRTLVIEDCLDILLDGENGDYIPATFANGYDSPGIFTKSVITMIDYRFNSDGVRDGSSKYVAKYTLHIGRINLYNDKTFSDIRDKDVPVIKITNAPTQIWGLDMYANIRCGRWFGKVGGDSNISLFSFTGVKIIADGRYITHVNLYGNVIHTYYGYVFDIINGAWMNGIKLFGSTNCAIGAYSDKLSSIYLYGLHQSNVQFSDNNVGYFTFPSISVDQSYVWDLNTGKTIKSALYKVKVEQIGTSYEYYNTAGGTLFSKFIHIQTEIANNILMQANLLDLLYKGSTKTPITNLSYTLNGESVFRFSNTIGTVFNLDRLFKYTPENATGRPNNLPIFNRAYVKYVSSTSLTIAISFRFNTIESGIYNLWYMNPSLSRTTLIIKKYESSSYTDGIIIVSENDVVNLGYYNLLQYPIIKRYAYYSAELSITITSASTMFALPFIALTNNITGDTPDTVAYNITGGSLPILEAGSNWGKVIYNQVLNKQAIWDGLRYIEYDGAKYNVRRTGPFSQKPSASDIYVGFRYFCTDKRTAEGANDGIEIIHKGGDIWVDALGRLIT